MPAGGGEQRRDAVWAACLNAGQVCTSAERFYVHERIYDAYLERFCEHAGAVRLGDPLQPQTGMRPVVNAAQRGKVERQRADAVAGGAHILAGGGRGPHARGFFHEPTVVTDVPHDADLLVEETFGPVAPIVRVGSLDEAIAGQRIPLRSRRERLHQAARQRDEVHARAARRHRLDQ